MRISTRKIQLLLITSGGGAVAAMVSWIPGVDAITAADVGVGAAKAGASTFVSCLAG